MTMSSKEAVIALAYRNEGNLFCKFNFHKADQFGGTIFIAKRKIIILSSQLYFYRFPNNP